LRVAATPIARRPRARLFAAPLGHRAYYLKEHPRVLVVIPDGDDAGRPWLQCQGMARPAPAPDWGAFQQEDSGVARPDGLYLVLRVTSERIDLVDERHGWGRRENLDL
jgi:hypothetical protein